MVSGDVYDRALPHVDAVALADDTFARLAASRAQVVVSSGNHDSARRLGFGSRLMDAAGVYVRTDASSVGTPVLLADRHGDVAIHAIPYLDPSALLEPWGLGRRSHEAALSEAMTRVRADLAARPASTRSVVLAHAFVAGATPSESERDISVGGVSRVATSVFDGIDYTALGHLHGPHVLDERLRYSGSPLAYSFSEADQVKGSWLVDLDATGFASAAWVAAPVPRRLARLSGTLEQLLADPALAAHEDDWVQATLTDERRPVASDGAAATPVPPHPRPPVPGARRRRAHAASARARHERPRDRARLRAARARLASRARRSPPSCARRSTPAATTRTRTSSSARRQARRAVPGEAAPPPGRRFRTVRRPGLDRLRRALRRRALPPQRPDRRGQVQRPRRGLLRALRRRPRRPRGGQAAALRPRRRRRRAAGRARGDLVRTAVPHRPVTRVDPTQEARHRHHHRAGARRDLRAPPSRRRRSTSGTRSAPASTRRATSSPGWSA